MLAGRSDVRLEDAAPLVPEADDAASAHLAGAVQLWPHRHGTDAMFLALLLESVTSRSGARAPNARTPQLSASRPGQQTESLGFGLVNPNSGRSARPAKVPASASTPHSQPCRLNEAMPPK